MEIFVNGQFLNYRVEFNGMVAYNPVNFLNYTCEEGFSAKVDLDGEILEVDTMFLSIPKVRGQEPEVKRDKIYCNSCETVQFEDECEVHYNNDCDYYYSTCPNCKEVIDSEM